MLWLSALRRYAQFTGRGGRAEFWQFIAFYTAALVAAFLLDYSLGGYYAAPTFISLVLLGLLVPSLAVTVRRLHDRGRSGWLLCGVWALNGGNAQVERFRISARGFPIDALWAVFAGALLVATVALFVFLLVQLIQSGDPAPNSFGTSTDEPGQVPPGLLAAFQAVVGTGRPASFVATGPTPAPIMDPVVQLERLAALRRQELLTQAEFDQQKAALLHPVGSATQA